MRQMIALLLLVSQIAAPPRAHGAEGEPRTFCEVQTGYRFEFPRDHFAHECFKTEWWYFTGNVVSAEGREFGFQLTFFRDGLETVYGNPSRWQVQDLYLAHFAVSDLGQRRFRHGDVIRRAGVGLAGADESTGRIWNGLWSAALREGVWELKAEEQDYAIDLRLIPEKETVLQGMDGISRKGPDSANASHYYSMTRLRTEGELRAEGQEFRVTGWAWMDHEFFTSQLRPELAGWDWISLQLDDGTELMLFQLRRRNGQRDNYSAGSFVDRDGRVTQLRAEDFQMTAETLWRSPQSGGRYPVEWQVNVPGLNLAVQITAAFPAQEFDARTTTGMFYWEGSVRASGRREGRSISGRGYLEMTGYAGELPSSLYGPTERMPEE